QDRAALEKVLAPDFTLVVATAPHYHFDRENWIDLAVGPYRCSRLLYENVQFHRLSADIIAMSAIADQDAALGREDRSGRFFVSDLLKKNGSSWQISARYSSPPAEMDRTVTVLIGPALEQAPPLEMSK